MKKQKTWILVLVLAVLLLALGGFVAFYVYQASMENTSREKTLSKAGIQTFADWTDVEAFQNVPAMIVEGTKISEAADYGQQTYIITVSGTGKKDYEEYLQVLETDGFIRYADNGGEGLDGAVYTASFQKEDVTLTVTHIVKIDMTYLAACKNQPLSEHLIYQDTYIADNIKGKQTTLTMLEQYEFGNSFVIQLKNGHFIVNDGGMSQDTPYLLDYLESLTPEGEKPVIEAWVISHAHTDHMGVFTSLASTPEYLDRIYIDGFYCNFPRDEIMQRLFSGGFGMISSMQAMANGKAKSSDGGSPKIYRPQTGQKYYFDDIVIEVLHTQEQLLDDNYARADINDTSLWLNYVIEGQRFLLSGDADKGAMQIVMRNYDEDSLKWDIFAVFHHSLNTWIPFTEASKFTTVLFTSNKTTPRNTEIYLDGYLNSRDASTHLFEHCEEYYTWDNGAVRLTFPYEVGTAEILPPCQWQYHPDREEK